MHIGRLRKRHLLALREQRNVAARQLPGWKFRFTAADEFLSLRSPTGHAIFEDGAGQRIEADTLTCCHCARPFAVRRHGRKSKCLRCDAMTCGDPACDWCTGPSPMARRFGAA